MQLPRRRFNLNTAPPAYRKELAVLTDDQLAARKRRALNFTYQTEHERTRAERRHRDAVRRWVACADECNRRAEEKAKDDGEKP
jgi:hypothetical protein